MRIAIASVQVPFISGGAEILADMLKQELIKRGHEAELVTIPFKWYPYTSLFDCMLMGRMMDLSEVNGEKIDRVIAMKFPAYYVKHKHKVLWLMHQHRQAYDLWNTEYGDLQLLPNGKEIRDYIRTCDNQYLPEARRLFTIAQTTTNRLLKYNQIESTVLYHPPINHEKLHCQSYGDYVFYPSRIDTIKRQRLLVEAMKYTKTAVRVIIAGTGSKKETEFINHFIRKNHLENKVVMAGYISEEEKISHYANCLGVYFGAHNEDYGYITLEGMFSQKPVIVHNDAGEPLEFIKDDENGFVLRTDPNEIASKLDYLYEHKEEAKRLGENGRMSLMEKNMNWDYVIEQLLCA